MRESWTDDRLDDLNGKVDALRVEMKSEFRAVNDRFDKVNDRFDKVNDRFDKVNDRFDKIDDRLFAMQRLMVQVYGGLFAALIAAIAGLIATQL